MPALRRGAPPRSSKTFTALAADVPERGNVVGADRLRDALAASAEARRVPHRGRSHLAVVAVYKRLGERAGDDFERVSVTRPVAVVPPGDVSPVQAVRGRRPVSGEPVHEPEPVLVVPRASFDTVDRLHEATAVAGRHLRLRSKRPQERLPGGNLLVDENLAAAVARDPELRGAVGRRRPHPAAAREHERECGEEGRDEARTDHFTAFDRTAPTA